ncbi:MULTISPECIES: SHOCT domain-containing protein [Gordonibacter]|uniref:SHOCT domain-containing protein n=1 Tax=Gordonibacter faecis TaxID=3047475 RepID=A0ABT7DKR2_9ACTN|nr:MULTISPECIES: SHOCT domain-containing protein [unclassified Gordonibacter]MDJ1650115.1 SHOCT domain-containing protein [Gordonibacter sp. KGMB12511]HIW75559.1 SHOCT domain-containing protein [Candidatus Gordonibacter avicola]
MKILGMGVPELVFIFFSFLLPVGVILFIVWLVLKRRSTVDEKQRASAAAYQRLAQLDDLRKRGALTEEEFAQKKQQIMNEL